MPSMYSNAVIRRMAGSIYAVASVRRAAVGAIETYVVREWDSLSRSSVANDSPSAWDAELMTGRVVRELAEGSIYDIQISEKNRGNHATAGNS